MFSSNHFELSDIPDLSGKVAIITGSNTGIGRVCALEMARKHCQIIVASRSEDKGQAVVSEIKSATGNEKVEFVKLDLLSLQSVKTFADTFKSRYDKLHILLNNAGVMLCPYGLSEDGLETHFATNHVAHYYLTMQLLPLLIKSAPSRIVNVSSKGHQMTSLSARSLDKVNDEKGYNSTLQYGLSKACNILFTRELAKRLESRGIHNVYVNSNHPGVVKSDLTRHAIEQKSIWATVLESDYVGIPTEKGSLTQLYLATSPEVESMDIKGKYYVPFGKPGSVNPYSRCDKNAIKLWEFTEKLLKEKAPQYEGAPI
ncbi:hypothetical protein BDB00DRAFT_792750 [Zychaea mexicana]|uniref:uncharacterized protein n=1 Tax=Zychaea mexicana TaxID=64656 RepID=UPI0022FF047F|nr:uncharacterized protein BDB00DRAFT_792750 [Zychaea mexicana]KAI9484600.1 hypothetical protein BDB00DRAFT_792750 [Zychaea mexicana]